MPGRLSSIFAWLAGKGNQREPVAAPPPLVLPPEPPPLCPELSEVQRFRKLLEEEVDYAAATNLATAAIGNLFSAEEDKWRGTLADIRDKALLSCGTRVTGEELNLIASNFASDILFVTEEHRYFDCSGGFGTVITRMLTRVVLGAEIALGRESFAQVAWPQPYWNCNNLPPLDNRPPPLKVVATRHLAILDTVFTTTDLADTIRRIERELIERAEQHRKAMEAFVVQAVSDRQTLMMEWLAQLEAADDSQR